jgi:hypothetical protein
MTFYLKNRDMASLANVDMRLVTLLRRLFHLMFSDFSRILPVEVCCKLAKEINNPEDAEAVAVLQAV